MCNAVPPWRWQYEIQSMVIHAHREAAVDFKTGLATPREIFEPMMALISAEQEHLAGRELLKESNSP